MNNHFNKYKRQALVIRLVKSLLVGLAIGTLLVGVLLLLSKFEIWAIQPLYVYLIGIGACLLSGAGMYFLLRFNNRKLARHLDEEFVLKERVQTMVAFQQENGTLYDLQRKDTNATLEELSKSRKRLAWKRIWIYIVSVCVGVGAFLSAFLIKPKAEEPPAPPPVEGFAITEIQIAALEELIVYVGNSQMQSPYKENVMTALDVLLDELIIATTIDERDVALEKAVEEINAQTDASSFAVELMNALWTYQTTSVKQLAKALNYYDWSKDNEWTDFSGDWADFRTSLIHADIIMDNPDKVKMAQETGELLTRLQGYITQSLTRVGALETNTLCAQLKRLGEANEKYSNKTHLYGFSALGSMAESMGYDTLQKELDATFTTLGSEIYKGLQEHKANTDTGEYVMTRLKVFFGYMLPKFERPNFYEETNDAPGGDDEVGGGAGIGGGAEYGSDDLILDPMTNTYVEYGTILERYYKLMFGKVQDGDYTEQEKEAMEKYFAILYGGFDEEEGE